MGEITAAVEIDGQPLRRAFVEHLRAGGLGSEGLTLTDKNGSFTFDAGIFSKIDVKVYCQNSVIRVLDGAQFNWPVSFNAVASNEKLIEITNQKDHYRILNTCLDVYDTVWRQFKPYSNDGRAGFPLGKCRKLLDTFNSKKRIELSYPDRFWSGLGFVPSGDDDEDRRELAFVEPSGITNEGFPLVHIKDRTLDHRLFGDGSRERADPSLLPHELGHVFHFSALSGAGRAAVQAGYLAFLAERAVTTGDVFHGTAEKTSPFIAFIEAAGIFSERFFFFKKLVKPDLTGAALHRAFIADELSEQSSLSKPDGVLRQPDKHMQVGRRQSLDFLGSSPRQVNVGPRPRQQMRIRGVSDEITPVLDGDDCEGAVYGAIYLDFADRIGLQHAVELVLKSRKTDFDDFRQYVRGRNDDRWTAAIDAVKKTWKL